MKPLPPTHETELNPLCVLSGPTGVGKSGLAMAVALQCKGAIVSADSMQVYRGLWIGTAQPTMSEMEAIPHRLVGHVDPRDRYDAARFVEDAETAIQELRGKGLLPLVVGGTGMYLKSLVEGIFEGPSRNPEIRKRLKAEAQDLGIELLHDRLKSVDPEAANRIMPRDAVRIVRALEVYETTGHPISWWHRESRKEGPRHKAANVIVTRDRDDLYERIDCRVRTMLDAGWVDEVKRLLDSGVPEEAPGFRALGYREVLQHLRGELDANQLEAAIAQSSRNYAKRQLTWFRAVENAIWINLSSETPESSVASIRKAWKLE